MATILVVDDEEPILSIVAEVIEDMGHTVLRAENGRDALPVLRAAMPDLILCDVMMPFVDGLELCRTVKSDDATRHIKVLLMSAVPADRGSSAGADGFVHKPFSLDEIENAVTRGLSEQQVGSTS